MVARWKTIGDASLCVSVLCEAEVLQGLEAKGSDRLWDRYRSLLEGRLPVLDLTIEIARAYANMAGGLIRSGKPRPVVDLLIAATARTSGLVLATLNARHFQGIDGLAVEDWSTTPARETAAESGLPGDTSRARPRRQAIPPKRARETPVGCVQAMRPSLLHPGLPTATSAGQSI